MQPDARRTPLKADDISEADSISPPGDHIARVLHAVSLAGGGDIVVDAEQHDRVVGDCEVVEQGQDHRRNRKHRDQSQNAKWGLGQNCIGQFCFG
jgi:hypothetical protein